MGEESAKRVLFYVEELISKQSIGLFMSTVREGGNVFILQLGSNTHGTFSLISELAKGKCKGFIVIPEGKKGSGWRGFGKMVAEEEPRLCTSGIGNKGKGKVLDFQYSKKSIFSSDLCDSCGGKPWNEKAQIGGEGGHDFSNVSEVGPAVFKPNGST